MRFHDLLRLVVDSQADDWHAIVCGGGRSGPSYKEQFVFWDVYDGEHRNVLKTDSHTYYAVYKDDVSIALAWGMECEENFSEPWIAKFADSKAGWKFVDLFFNNSLVYRDTYIVVDGGRANLPLPDARDSLTVPKDYASLIRLIDQLDTRTSDYDRYFRQAGFTEISANWPSEE